MSDISKFNTQLQNALPLLIKNTVKVLEIEGKKSIQQNFAQQGRPQWKPKKIDDGRSILTGRSGKLQREINVMESSRTPNSVSIGSNLDYAKIQNEGGTIQVTAKMKKYFWAMYYKTNDEAYKALALRKVGSTITIPARPYLNVPASDYPRIMNQVEKVVAATMKTIR